MDDRRHRNESKIAQLYWTENILRSEISHCKLSGIYRIIHVLENALEEAEKLREEYEKKRDAI